MPDPSPFSPELIQQAIHDAMVQTPLPPGKNRAIVVTAGPDGAKAFIAAKAGEHWTFGGDIEWHGGGSFDGGAQIMASW
jgi:hypothetical protein